MSGGSFYRRNKLTNKDGMIYSVNDLAVGNVINVLGQKILIYDADKATRDYFRFPKNKFHIIY
jgi:hypothetical protein